MIDPVTGFIAGSAIGAGSNLIGTAVNAYQTNKWNSKQYKQTEKWNQINLDYAKNAQTYAAADRMRAGLSPLDTQTQAAPSANIASPQQADLSGFGAAGSAVQNGLQAAMRYNLDEKTVNAQIELNNALKSKAESEALKDKTETLSMIGKYKTELELQKAELERVKNVNSTYKKEVEARLAETYQRIADLESQISQRDTLTPSLVSLNQSSAGRNNAESSAIQNDLTFANAFGIPYSMIKNLNFNGPFSTAASDAFLGAAEAKNRAIENANDMVSLKDAYRQYVNSYDAAKDELDKELQSAIASGKSWYTDREVFEKLRERSKQLGKKLSFNAFVKMRNRKVK